MDFNDEEEKNFEEYKVDMEQLWYPYTDEEPCLDEETMNYLNDLADKVEINRLLGDGSSCEAQGLHRRFGHNIDSQVCSNLEKESERWRDYVVEEIKTGGQRIFLLGNQARYLCPGFVGFFTEVVTVFSDEWLLSGRHSLRLNGHW